MRFLPWLGSNQFPESAPVGLRLQAMLDGCAMVTRRLLQEAAVLTGPVSTIFVAGGWARSKSFLQLRADSVVQARQTIERRVNDLGVTEPSIAIKREP
ncbi:hypothetical protein B4Q13_16445 [Lacticaseibacillus rhamnosus]